MKRLDWQLIRPVRKDGDIDQPVEWMQVMTRLVREEARDGLSEDDRSLLEHLETTYLADTVPYCEAVAAPIVEDDPDWETRILDEFSHADVDIDLEDYLNARRKEPDCHRCPYATQYNLFPMDPCEFAAGALEQVLNDPALARQAERPMSPPAMRTLAEALSQVLDNDEYQPLEGIDARNYVEAAIVFLRFWSKRGYAVLPREIDDLLGLEDDLPLPQPGHLDDDDDDSGTYH